MMFYTLCHIWLVDIIFGSFDALLHSLVDTSRMKYKCAFKVGITFCPSLGTHTLCVFECEEKFKILEPHIGTTTIFRVYV